MSKNKVNLTEMARGAILEQFEIEMEKVLKNIIDPNTDPKKARKIQLTVQFKPTEDRDIAYIQAQAKSTLVPSKPIGTQIVIDQDVDGSILANEFGKGTIPGQVDIDEYEEETNNKKVVNMK